jgi:hypothetical protein
MDMDCQCSCLAMLSENTVRLQLQSRTRTDHTYDARKARCILHRIHGARDSDLSSDGVESANLELCYHM